MIPSVSSQNMHSQDLYDHMIALVESDFEAWSRIRQGDRPWTILFETGTTNQFSCYEDSQQQNQTKRKSIYDEYENLFWKPTSWYMHLWNRIKRFLYFLTGPKFICSIFGIVSLSVFIMIALLKFKFCSNQLSFDSLRKVHIFLRSNF